MATASNCATTVKARLDRTAAVQLSGDRKVGPHRGLRLGSREPRGIGRGK
jgi:hypothetical protein